MPMHCESCGSYQGEQDTIVTMRKLDPDQRSLLKQALFDRKPDRYRDYHHIVVCEKCSRSLGGQGWEEIDRGKAD
jgi:hypothetical protein